jgi:hypothetical protein
VIHRGSDLTTDQLRDLIQDAHINFLLGAGASMPFFSLLGDVEILLTEIDAFRDDDAARLHARASVLGSFFEGVIVKNKALLARSGGSDSLLRTYETFLQTMNRLLLRRRSAILNKQVNLFTTNVDLAIEVASEALQLELNDGFNGRFEPKFSTSNFGSVVSRRSLQYDNLSEIPTFNLLKLHGSVGWCTKEVIADGATRTEIGFDGELAQVTAAADALATVRAELTAVAKATSAAELLTAGLGSTTDFAGFIGLYDQLAIVNPTKAKFQQTVLNQNYYDLLRLFSNEMEKENAVLFVIGFSCRDEHIRELIVRAARVNPTLQVIVFAHTFSSADEVEAQFEGHPITNGNIRIVEPALGAAGEGEVNLSLWNITKHFFEPLVPRPARPPAAQVDVNITLKEPLLPADD